ncbi:hypothetical protein Esti_000686 [Eimeria stiedai]
MAMKLLVAWACLALTGLQPAESGATGKWTPQPGQPGVPPAGQPQVPAWWQGLPAGQGQHASSHQLPGAAGAPYQQFAGGGFHPFQNLQGTAPMQQMPGTAAAPFLQQLPGAPAATSLKQLTGVPASPSMQPLPGLPTTPSLQQYAVGAAPTSQLQLPGAPGGTSHKQLAGGGGPPSRFPGALMHDGLELVQHRTRVPAASASLGSTGLGSFGLAAEGGTWRDSNTFAAVQELHAQVIRLFRRQGRDTAWAHGGSEVVVPVENLTNVLLELSKLIPAVILFCETERLQKGPHVDPLQGARIHSGSRNVSFPADQFVLQGMSYARRATAQLRAMRDLLTNILAASSSKESLGPEIQRFRAATADLKDVYQLGSHVASAAVGAVLPYVSSCSFFPKGDPEGTYKLWSLVGARFSSTLRYIYHVLAAVRSASSKLGELVSGEEQPRSLLDFSRLQSLSKAASHLETAEARSASTVRYFNELAAAYKQHIQEQAGGGSDFQQRRIGGDGEVSEKPSLDRAELSLLADDLSLDSEVPRRSMQDGKSEAVQQIAQEEGRASPEWQHLEDSGDEEDGMLQTAEGE